MEVKIIAKLSVYELRMLAEFVIENELGLAISDKKVFTVGDLKLEKVSRDRIEVTRIG